MKAKLTRRIIATLLVVVMLLAIVPTAFAGTFPDVPAGSWFEEAVEYCADNGLMSGTDTGDFNPTGKVTREQTVQTLYALEGKPEVAFADKFGDVKEGKWYTSAILWAVDNEITSGTGDGNFGVGKNVTREQVALFLLAYANLTGKDTSASAELDKFPDKAKADTWAVDALKWAVAEGFLSGKKVGGETLLAPLDELTRAELAVILANFNEYVTTEDPPVTELHSVVIPDGADMLKYGHIDIDIPADEFLKVFALGDTVTVTLDGYGSFDMPVCASYDDVAAGEMLLRVVSGKDYIILAINYGQIALEQGIVEKAPDGSETAYIVKEGITFPIAVTITKKITQVKSVVIPDGADMLKYGHIDIDYPADDFLTEFELGNTVTVELDGYDTFEVPVCASYDDVAAGEKLLRVVSGKDYIILAINYGQIALEQGIVEKAPDGSETAYAVKEGVSFPINVTITLKQKAGEGENILGNLIRTDIRENYSGLTDAQFANFRKITTTGIKDGILYRSSSPINPEIGRNLYADAAAEAAGVKTFINLADTEAGATGYPDYAASYYSAQNHIFLGLPAAFTTDAFKSGLAEGLRYIISNEGPYLVHCTEGKDRAGLTAAILECLMGATCDEITDDYVETYRNYYSVENGAQRALTAKEEEAAAKVILANLKLCFGVEITETTDLVAAAEAYMKSIGLTDAEITTLKARLGE